MKQPIRTLKINILANYLAMGIVAVAPILALPWYLALLGPKIFGLVAFIMMLQTLLGLFDAGMSQALVREVVVRLNFKERGRHSTAALLFGFERIYWLFALCACGVTLLFADNIARSWLKLEDSTTELGRLAVYGGATIFATQFPGFLYRSVMVGAQAQVKLSGLTFGGALLRHLGGVLVVTIWPTLTAYLIWQASVSLLETLARAKFAWASVGVKRRKSKWDPKELHSVWRSIMGMSGAIWLGAITLQMDKIVLSQSVSIEQFGYYVIAANIGVGVLQLIYPLLQAILPRAIELQKNSVASRSLYLKAYRLIGIIIAMGVVIFSLTGEWLLHYWLSDYHIVDTIYPILAILLIGTALNAIYTIGYINWIANEKIYRIFQVNALGLALSVALIPPLVNWYGTIGAAFGWVATNLIGFIISLEWLIRKKNV